MMNRLRRILVLALLLAPLLTTVFAAGGAHAHQQRNALTRIVFNERTGNIEIMHRINLHDAEHAARDLWGRADFYKDADTAPENGGGQKQLFSDYVRSRFSIAKKDGPPIELTPVGEEIDGEFLWVYHEAPMRSAGKIDAMTVDNKILLEFWDDQANLVNIEKDGVVRSLRFFGATGPQTVNLQIEKRP